MYHHNNEYGYVVAVCINCKHHSEALFVTEQHFKHPQRSYLNSPFVICSSVAERTMGIV